MCQLCRECKNLTCRWWWTIACLDRPVNGRFVAEGRKFGLDLQEPECFGAGEEHSISEEPKRIALIHELKHAN